MEIKDPTKKYKTNSHLVYSCYYHVIFCPKYRRKCLIDNVEIRLKELFLEISNKYNFEIPDLEVMPDHVHVLVEASTKYSPAQIAGYFKGISSKLLRQDFPDEIKRCIWKEGTLWARGYYIASVADNVTTEVVKEYINNQKLEAKEHK